MAALLAIRDYRLVFEGFEGTAHVLDGIDLTLEPGETVGVVGETGCGKSVLAKSILKLLPSPPARVRSGSIFFKDTDILGAGGLGSSLRMLFASTCLLYTSPSPRDRTRSRMPSSA